ncbi:MAG: hypothetical protein LC650_03035 [Actinobacteria bacterium]|nr:hypothetical protein [Actinomycetota bacterium]
MQTVAERFTAYLNDFHTYSEPRDDKLDAWLHQAYADVIKAGKSYINWNLIYFSPSSSTACPRELYMKAKKAKRDEQRFLPRQRRHMAQGTAIGDWLQRELLLAERHYEKLSGNEPAFKMALKDGKPAFEDFVFKQKPVTHNGQTFSVLGTTDGIMRDSVTGELVGLEIKTKQETPSKTSVKSMKEADDKHIDQVIAYSVMYGIDKWLIVYVNTAKKKWFSTQDEDDATPDIRAFEIDVTDDMRKRVLDYFAFVTKAVHDEEPPKLSLDKWRFNGMKRACALDLSEGEISELEGKVDIAEMSGSPNWVIKQWRANVEQIRSIRKEATK